MIALLIIVVTALYEPHYEQVALTWVQTSDAPTVLIGKFDADGVWSVIRIHEASRRGPQRAIDYSPREGDRYAIAECWPADVGFNTCTYVARDIVAQRHVMYLPRI